MAIRSATPSDAAAILEIYAPFIRNTCISFETEVPTIAEFASRMEKIQATHPYLVCEINGQIVGFAHSAQHRERAAYEHSADASVYVSPMHHRKGIGRALYTALMELLQKQGIHMVFAGIALPNEKSLGLHRALGFSEVGVYHQVGYKFGKWLDVMWMEKALRACDATEGVDPMRLLTLDDLPLYAEVIRQSFATVAHDFDLTKDNCPAHTSFITNERLKSKHKDGYYPFGYFSHKKLVGFVSLSNVGDGEYVLNHLAVLPEARRRGFGKAMLSFCKEKVREFNGIKITLSTMEENTALTAWYTAYGFAHIATKKYDHLPFRVGYMEWHV